MFNVRPKFSETFNHLFRKEIVYITFVAMFSCQVTKNDERFSPPSCNCSGSERVGRLRERERRGEKESEREKEYK